MTEDVVLLLVTLAAMLFVMAGAGWTADKLAAYEPPAKAKPRLCRPLRVRKAARKEGPRIRQIDFPDRPGAKLGE